VTTSGSPGLIATYAEWLPVTDQTPVITLGEGGTPLVHARALSERTGCEVYLKVEGVNPTGSFKDRGMTLAISKAVEKGATAVACASTGNTSASAAAYAAKAGIDCVVLVPAGRIAAAKLAQAVVHGARLVQVDGGFDDCLTLSRALADRYPLSLVNSVNRFRLEGQKTAAFEVVDTLGRAPDIHCLPVGNAGNITAYWLGYRQYAEAGRCGLPQMWGVQAAGAAPLVTGSPVAEPHTVASAIRIGNPASWAEAEAARTESGGRFDAAEDDDLLEAQRLLAAEEGVFVEPASAAPVAGLLAREKEGALPAGSLVVCTVTGHGLKDVEVALTGLTVDVIPVPADLGATAAALGL
jgi:threonine synthase